MVNYFTNHLRELFETPIGRPRYKFEEHGINPLDDVLAYSTRDKPIRYSERSSNPLRRALGRVWDDVKKK